jgi:hypothetical protein
MARGGHELPKVSPGPAMACHSLPFYGLWTSRPCLTQRAGGLRTMVYDKGKFNLILNLSLVFHFFQAFFLLSNLYLKNYRPNHTLKLIKTHKNLRFK